MTHCFSLFSSCPLGITGLLIFFFFLRLETLLFNYLLVVMLEICFLGRHNGILLCLRKFCILINCSKIIDITGQWWITLLTACLIFAFNQYAFFECLLYIRDGSLQLFSWISALILRQEIAPRVCLFCAWCSSVLWILLESDTSVVHLTVIQSLSPGLAASPTSPHEGVTPSQTSGRDGEKKGF